MNICAILPKLSILLIMCSFITANIQNQQHLEVEELCPTPTTGKEEDIGQRMGHFVERKKKEILESQEPAVVLFNKRGQMEYGWQTQLLDHIRNSLEKWLWSWTPKSEEISAIQTELNKMMEQFGKEIVLLQSAEDVPNFHGIVPILERISKNHLVPIVARINPEWVVKIENSGMQRDSKPHENHKIPSNGKDDAGNKQTNLLVETALGALSKLMVDIKAGNVGEHAAFDHSSIGKQLLALREKVEQTLETQLSQIGSMLQMSDNHGLTSFLAEQFRGGVWDWLAECADKHHCGANGACIGEMAIKGERMLQSVGSNLGRNSDTQGRMKRASGDNSTKITILKCVWYAGVFLFGYTMYKITKCIYISGDATAVVHPLAGANANNVAAAQNNGHPNEVAINVAAPPPQNNNNNNNNNTMTRAQKRAYVMAATFACVGFYSTIMLLLVPSYYERHHHHHQQH